MKKLINIFVSLMLMSALPFLFGQDVNAPSSQKKSLELVSYDIVVSGAVATFRWATNLKSEGSLELQAVDDLGAFPPVGPILLMSDSVGKRHVVSAPINPGVLYRFTLISTTKEFEKVELQGNLPL